LVTRESSPKDRRSFVIKLTSSGKKKAARIHRQLESLEAQVLRANDRRAVEGFGEVIRNLEEKAAEE
jgi:DNA-binding MarR family transcriptional regulator